MKRRILLSLLVIAILALAACQNPNAPAGGQPAAPAATEEGGEEATAPEAAAGVSEFHAAWPYQPPPIGHYNTFVPDSLALGIYQDLMEPSLFIYMWATGEWLPLAGAEWSLVDDTTIEVKLIEGAAWSDGSAFTSQDVVDTFDIVRLLNQTVWRYLSEVTAVDDTTVRFILNEPTNIGPRYVLRNTRIHASSVYGEWAQRTRDLVAAGSTPDGEDWQAALTEFNQFRPEEIVVLGPYQIDPASITESTLILNKVPTSYWADTVRFDRIVNYNGETPTITPLVLSGDVDYATHGFPPATVQEFMAQGYRIIRPPIYNGPVVGFNHTIHPFEMKEFRQAIAYAIDRAQNAQVSMAESGVPVEWMTGMSDNFADMWLTEEVKAQLNTYEYDPAMAEELLTGIGFTRDSDGVWLDDTGARIEVEYLFQAEFADWSASARNACEQLTAFGIACTGRSITFTQFNPDIWAGNFELASMSWGAGDPHPHFSYVQNLRTFNEAMSGLGDVTRPGMSFDLNVTTEALGELDLNALIDASAVGADVEAQKEAIGQLAIAYNELLPAVPLWERYGNNPAPSRFAAGWLPDDDPIYLNSPYSDSFVIIQILDGTLHPAGSE
jgi:peptide/nickel transport system substrate-binding protein